MEAGHELRDFVRAMDKLKKTRELTPDENDRLVEARRVLEAASRTEARNERRAAAKRSKQLSQAKQSSARKTQPAVKASKRATGYTHDSLGFRREKGRKATRTTYMTGGSIHVVSGGLPSLGKRY